MAYSLYIDNREDLQAANLFCRLMKLWYGYSVDLSAEKAADILAFRNDRLPEEGFGITLRDNRVLVEGNGKRGITYALAALIKRFDGEGFTAAEIKESPSMPFRGVHLYMPAKEDVEGFRLIIDMLAYLKLNTLIIEVGGGMEYKKHPEINQGWERFCRAMLNFPGGPVGFQGSDIYWKDSTHTELGGGSYLPQEIVRELVNYAKGYGMEVVPELQFHSHAYYITTVYPNMAERKADHFPDTICPHSEEAYNLYYELADEVIDVFQPNMVSIGHDEIRVIGHCDICRNYSGHELLSYEINRLHEFYKSRNIGIAMWCEKLQNIASYYTKKYAAGVEENRVNSFGRKWHLPATWEAIKDIPEDILFLDWQYGWSWDSQDQTEEYGHRQIFGNFHGELTRGWRRRIASPCVIGGEVSSWCLAEESTLGHDGILGDIWYSSLVLWDKEHDENRYDIYQTEMREELPRIRELLRGKRSAAVSGISGEAEILYTAGYLSENSILSKDLPNRQIWNRLKDNMPGIIAGTPVGESELIFSVNKKVQSLIFVHTCLGDAKYIPSYRIKFEDWCPAVYAIRYEDGSTVFVNVRFGTDIGSTKTKIGRKVNYTGATPEDPEGFRVTPEECPDPPLYVLESSWQNSLIYSANPFESNGKQAYIMEWENPRSEIAVERVFAVNTVKTKDEQVLLYLAAAVV